MGHTVYISFKREDEAYKTAIQQMEHLDYIDRSLNERIRSDDPDYIMQRIRSEYLGPSTVTIFLIGLYSAESLGADEQYYIKKELQGSLYNGKGNTKNGLLGVVLPDMQETIFDGKYDCLKCGGSHNHVRINDSTVIKEFGYNYYIPHGKCAWSEEERYCVLTGWDNFDSDPSGWVEKAFAKRSTPIAAKTRVRP